MINSIKKLPKVIKIERLEMRKLDATPENAKLVFDAVKNENPDNFYFNPIAKNAVPKTVSEMLKKMQQEEEYSKSTGANYYIFHNDKLIGYRRFHFFDDATKTLQMSIVWLLRSAWGKGFAKETSDKIEEIAFNILGANRITHQCSTENVRSANSIKTSGFHLDGISRQGGVYSDNKVYDVTFWSKLKSEYNK